MKTMDSNAIRIYNTPKGPQVYFGSLRIHHWPIGLASAILGVLGLLFDDDNNHGKYYTGLFIGGVLTFLDDLPDFLAFIDNLQ